MLWGAYKGGSSRAMLVVAKHDLRRGASQTVDVFDVGRGSAVVSISQCKKKVSKEKKKKKHTPSPFQRIERLWGLK